MDIRTLTQQKLDSVLLPEGILSHHIRRVEISTIKNSTKPVNKDEYVVFRIVSNKNRGYGDGKPKLLQFYIDINYYYSFDKNSKRFKDAEKRIKAIIKAFLADGKFKLANGQSDLYDLDNPYRGINIEFLFVGVNDYGN